MNLTDVIITVAGVAAVFGAAFIITLIEEWRAKGK
jgi:hypothetical protein